tara:strand:- start:1463 stop:1735 length:273 start_codon:yes stop_codon:yes gene_type:complete
MKMEQQQTVQETKVWTNIEVTWNDDFRYWEITGDNIESGQYENLGLSDIKQDAVEDAKIYAFDTSCGPARGERVKIYSKAGKLLKTVEAA